MITKSERINLVATKGQVAAWRLAAEQAGLSLSELLRQAAEQRVVADARRPDGAVDLDRLLAFCRERGIDIAETLREFARRGK